MITKMQAIKSLLPEASVVVRGYTKEATVEWYGSEEPLLTDAEINAEFDRLEMEEPFTACKEEAKNRIALTDWSVLPDVNISNKVEFEAYRAELRALIINPVVDPVFPTEPQPVWIA